MRGLVDRSTLKEEGAILPKEKEKGQRQKDKEFDKLQREQFFYIDPLVDCNYQPIVIDGDGKGIKNLITL